MAAMRLWPRSVRGWWGPSPVADSSLWSPARRASERCAIARVIAREAEALGVLVTWGHAWEFADAPPYFPVWPCLRALGIDVGKDALHKHDEGHAFHLLENVVASLARASSAAPFLWILEDLHAAVEELRDNDANNDANNDTSCEGATHF